MDFSLVNAPTGESGPRKAPRTVPHENERRKLRGLTILVAEDDLDSRDMLGYVLGEEGARCVVASSGREAFEAFLGSSPDLLVADLWMPDGDGFELIRRIRALSPEQGGLIPAIAVSGGANVEEALMAGYHVLLLKPYDTRQIVGLVDEFVRGDQFPPSPRPTWSLAESAPGVISITYAGYVRGADVRESMLAVVELLNERACRVTIDMRGVTGFSVVGAYVGERIIWPHRHAVIDARIIGRSALALSMASAACSTLGIKCRIDIG
jgi:CheY-like chemotaxis protein